MNLTDLLAKQSHDDRIRTLARLEGMSMAMRIVRNRANDLHEMAACLPEGDEANRLAAAEHEVNTVCSMIRLVQVSIGNGQNPFGELSPAEVNEIMRIY